jgi:hypothetical protein
MYFVTKKNFQFESNLSSYYWKRKIKNQILKEISDFKFILRIWDIIKMLMLFIIKSNTYVLHVKGLKLIFKSINILDVIFLFSFSYYIHRIENYTSNNIWWLKKTKLGMKFEIVVLFYCEFILFVRIWLLDNSRASLIRLQTLHNLK